MAQVRTDECINITFDAIELVFKHLKEYESQGYKLESAVSNNHQVEVVLRRIIDGTLNTN